MNKVGQARNCNAWHLGLLFNPENAGDMFKILVDPQQTTQHYIPEDKTLQIIFYLLIYFWQKHANYLFLLGSKCIRKI
jgi:hypothetical protein